MTTRNNEPPLDAGSVQSSKGMQKVALCITLRVNSSLYGCFSVVAIVVCHVCIICVHNAMTTDFCNFSLMYIVYTFQYPLVFIAFHFTFVMLSYKTVDMVKA